MSEFSGENFRGSPGPGSVSAGSEPADLTQGIPLIRQIGDYEIIEELGRGGMGVVFKARQMSLNRIVAIKMILGQTFANEKDRIRFHREAELIAALTHPNIVSIHEIGEIEGQAFYSMEYIEGITMYEMSRGKSLGWKQAARFALMISQAMQFAHERGVIHRDLKPHNVMVDSTHKVHIMDFGLARDINVESGLTLKGDAIGTPNYMSPEQCEGNMELTVATDVYAIGAVLYEMLTSIPPFIGTHVPELMEKVRNKIPLEPRLINPSIPRDLNTICMKCLEKDPARRYRTAGNLAEELDRVLRDVPIEAKPISGFERGWRWCKRNRSLATVMSCSAGIIFLGTLMAFVLLNRARLEAKAAETMAKRAEADAESQRDQATAALEELQKTEYELVSKDKQLDDANGKISQQKGIIANESNITAQQDIQHEMAQAIGLFRDLHVWGAQAAADKIVAEQPNSPDAWYLHGQLAVVQGKISDAVTDFKKASGLMPNGLDARGQALLDLLTRYAAIASQTPDGRLTQKDTLNLLRDIQAKDKYFALVETQAEARELQLKSIRSAVSLDNDGKYGDADHISVSSDGDEVMLILKNIPDNINLSALKQFPIFTALHIENTGIKSLEPFAGMQFTRVELINSPISALNVLNMMPLHTLLLKDIPEEWQCPLRNAPLHSLTLIRVKPPYQAAFQNWSLEELKISDEPLPDKFAVPKGVTSLGLARTGLTSLQLVASLKLESLDVSGNPDLNNLEPLQNMVTLRRLDLSDTGVDSLLPLSSLRLETVRLRHTRVVQVCFLNEMPLHELDLRGSPVLDFAKLAKTPPVFFPPQAP